MDSRYSKISYRLVILWIITVDLSVDGARPFVNHPTCPRDPELARGRHCAKKCLIDDDCKSRRKCLCDFPCGMSCVKPKKPCPQPGKIENGHVLIDTKANKKGNYTFGARIRFVCVEGFVLEGAMESICRGDGQWSAELPTCETNVAQCKLPPWVPFAKHKTPMGMALFPLGTEVQYRCEHGYIMHGFNRARCIGEGRWWGPKMSCSPISCGHPGKVENSDRHGNVFVYPFQVKYVCLEGYRMMDPTLPSPTGVRTCQANGQWSGRTPLCHPIKCPVLARPANGTVRGLDRAYGGVAFFQCLEGFKIIGDSRRKCRTDGTWTGKEVYCEQVDCGIPGPLINGYLDIEGTTYNSIIKFRCNGRTTFEGKGIETMCQQDGTWSIPLPTCWNKCRVPAISNNTITGLYWEHGYDLQYDCPEGEERNSTEYPKCYNGTWTIPPVCVPASCKSRPDDIRDGHVRFYTMQHGDRARYKCNTGFFLIGSEYVTCHYGKWNGAVPICAKVPCEHPGEFLHGIIYLVGVTGKFDYGSYVKDIWHNQKIEYHCDREYKRVGPGAATCVAGKWSPPQRPFCVKKRHPKIIYLFRGRRSLSNRAVRSEADKEAGDLEQLRSWEEKGLCEVPTIANGKVTNYPEGYYVPHSAVLDITCASGYKLPAKSGESRCNDGLWTQIPTCLVSYPEGKFRKVM